MKKWEYIGGWALTEQDVGSDASNLNTTCERLPNGKWKINGDKRWIGNANRDLMVVFARDKASKKIKAFIVFLNSKGVRRHMIQRKLSLRAVHNMQVHFDDVIVEEKWRLPKVFDFQTVASMLAHSRLYVCWLALGIGLGIYDNVIKYISNRTQFRKKISQFQIIQEKLVRIMGNIQASLCLAMQLTKLHERGEVTIGKLCLGKAWITSKIRESAALGREMLGGNGIISDYYVMRALVDMEGIYTYEGTYDINALIAGRELTSYSSFK